VAVYIGIERSTRNDETSRRHTLSGVGWANNDLTGAVNSYLLFSKDEPDTGSAVVCVHPTESARLLRWGRRNHTTVQWSSAHDWQR